MQQFSSGVHNDRIRISLKHVISILDLSVFFMVQDLGLTQNLKVVFHSDHVSASGLVENFIKL
jgi:hypothetical protein